MISRAFASFGRIVLLGAGAALVRVELQEFPVLSWAVRVEGNGMDRRTLRTRVGVVLLAVFGFVAVGCGSTAYKKFDMNVSLDPAVSASESVTVDIIALGGDRAEELESMPMRRYWTLNDPYREGLLAEGVLWTARLDASNRTAMLKSREGQFWNSPTWKSGGKLFVLAKLRGVGPGPNGDPRRRSILRDAQLWDQNRIDVTVKSNGISYSPTEKSVAP